jgi:hypothetical protein
MLAFAASMVAIAGCATSTSTPYQPLSSANRISGGYSDERLSENRFRVSFAGNALTSREQVESYLLFRAAELTIEQGRTWFVIEDRVVEHEVERSARRDPIYDPWFGTYYGYWRPYWRYYGPGGWRAWYPYYGHSFWTDHVDIREVDRFEAIAEIRLGDGPMPNGNLRAFDAREVVDRIGPRTAYPADG